MPANEKTQREGEGNIKAGIWAAFRIGIRCIMRANYDIDLLIQQDGGVPEPEPEPESGQEPHRPRLSRRESQPLGQLCGATRFIRPIEPQVPQQERKLEQIVHEL